MPMQILKYLLILLLSLSIPVVGYSRIALGISICPMHKAAYPMDSSVQHVSGQMHNCYAHQKTLPQKNEACKLGDACCKPGCNFSQDMAFSFALFIMPEHIV